MRKLEKEHSPNPVFWSKDVLRRRRRRFLTITPDMDGSQACKGMGLGSSGSSSGPEGHLKMTRQAPPTRSHVRLNIYTTILLESYSTTQQRRAFRVFYLKRAHEDKGYDVVPIFRDLRIAGQMRGTATAPRIPGRFRNRVPLSRRHPSCKSGIPHGAGAISRARMVAIPMGMHYSLF